MEDKKLLFIVISTLASCVSLGLIIGSFFLKNENTKNYIILVAFAILIIQKIIEIIKVKETRKISSAILILLATALGYFIGVRF
ncbi:MULTISPECIES: hypothetical protein [unclassified Gemella]|uniref:hypothetical protein n=1 Tax=unclassified Gemella TaxID=2624949 RepID=UPI001C0415CC|nr:MULTISPECIES: hypothetical protein [unclassified Gemella]MBU0278196.1 hypothetical protein [Gemella sp. zg-1178]QWQ38847.1 hypothetical protein KMP11_00325 [Gemella sp. zg-570]